MDNDIIPIASSRKSVDTLAGKILVAKTVHSDYYSRLNGRRLDARPGMMIVALMEGTSTVSSHQKVVKFIYNGFHGELALNSEFDNNWCIISPDNRLDGKCFVFTGALTNTRDYYKTLVECFGGVFGWLCARALDISSWGILPLVVILTTSPRRLRRLATWECL